MAKKKQKPDSDKPKQARHSRRGPETAPPEWRAVEGRMWGRGDAAETPLERAQEIMYQAFEEPDPARRVQLAGEALTVSPDCADAHLVLAENAPTRKDALEQYRQAVAAGERALGEDFFRNQVGHFWGILESRPYMRAREGLAHALWTAGRRDEAIGHLHEMLRLNPGDNQGLRYTLAGWLLAEGRDDDLERLLEQYQEGSALWAYTRALLAFRRQGDTLEARQLLKTAKLRNKYVPAYLTGVKFPPAESPGYYSLGDESEALMVVENCLPGWRSTPGAVAWLRGTIKPARKKRAPARKAQGPSPRGKQGLQRLPQEPEVWQADARLMPIWVETAAGRSHPWLVLVVSCDHGLILAHNVLETEPTLGDLWDALASAMQHPAAGEPHRPGELQVRPGGPWQGLRKDIEEVGVRLVESGELEEVGAVFEGLAEQMGGKEPPGLLASGLTPEQLGSFYEAAAFFYREAPWRRMGYEAAFRVECDRFRGGPWYGVVFGQSGLAFGLALYDDLRLLQGLWSDRGSDEDHARETVATSVTFGEETELAAADLEAARRFNWKVAQPEAYPIVYRKERGQTMRPPLAWELELMEGCLRAVPEFIKRRRPDDPTTEEILVTTVSGELPLRLQWAAEAPV
jgi:tetratricopeptide (TPR) repeat protein